MPWDTDGKYYSQEEWDLKYPRVPDGQGGYTQRGGLQSPPSPTPYASGQNALPGMAKTWVPFSYTADGWETPRSYEARLYGFRHDGDPEYWKWVDAGKPPRPTVPGVERGRVDTIGTQDINNWYNSQKGLEGKSPFEGQANPDTSWLDSPPNDALGLPGTGRWAGQQPGKPYYQQNAGAETTTGGGTGGALTPDVVSEKDVTNVQEQPQADSGIPIDRDPRMRRMIERMVASALPQRDANFSVGAGAARDAGPGIPNVQGVGASVGASMPPPPGMPMALGSTTQIPRQMPPPPDRDAMIGAPTPPTGGTMQIPRQTPMRGLLGGLQGAAARVPNLSGGQNYMYPGRAPQARDANYSTNYGATYRPKNAPMPPGMQQQIGNQIRKKAFPWDQGMMV